MLDDNTTHNLDSATSTLTEHSEAAPEIAAARGVEVRDQELDIVHPDGEVINLFGLAIRHGLTANDLKTAIFAYPTGASDIGSML